VEPHTLRNHRAPSCIGSVCFTFLNRVTCGNVYDVQSRRVTTAWARPYGRTILAPCCHHTNGRSGFPYGICKSSLVEYYTTSERHAVYITCGVPELFKTCVAAVTPLPFRVWKAVACSFSLDCYDCPEDSQISIDIL
jgi:hypothetical protein